MKAFVLFFVRCFFPKETVWHQHWLDNQQFGEYGPTIAFIRAVALYNAFVFPVTILTNEKVRKVTMLVDMVLAPTISALATSLEQHTPPLYKGKRVYLLACSLGVLYGIGDLYKNLKAGGVRSAHMRKPVGIVHNLLWPLFFGMLLTDSIGVLATILDPRTAISRKSRVLTMVALLAVCSVLYWGVKEFYEDGSLT